jgi:hypothetical protein
MHNMFIALFCRSVPVTLFALTLNIQPAPAQESGSGPTFYTGNYSTPFARYYAPYALQAAGAYLSVKTMDEARRVDDARESRSEARGEDVRRVVDYAIKARDPAERADLIEKARSYLRAWRYAFGSEKYLDCYENDPDCLKTTRAGRRIKLFAGPAFHVWTRSGVGAACSEVSIAFRGTDEDSTWGRYFTDWGSNADGVIGGVTDNSYRQLARNVNVILRKIAGLPCYKAGNPQIVSVGHSLGAGLGQLAALANSLENRNQGLAINKVFAFDASPVTGSSYVTQAVRDGNAKVEVDLIYQSQEILESLRGDDSSSCLRTMRFDALRGAGRKKLHRMSPLAREIVKMSYNEDGQMKYRVPPPLPDCKSPYIRPTTDEYIVPENLLISNPAAPVARVTSVDPGRAMNSFAMSGGFGIESAPVTEMIGSVAPAAEKKPNTPRSKKAGSAPAPALQLASDAAWPPG